MRLRVSNSSFLMCSGAIYFGYRKSVITGVVKRYGKAEDDGGLGGVSAAWRDLKFNDLGRDEVHALLTHRHELDHARCFFGSPLGLLIFRCYFAIDVTLDWLFSDFFIPGELGAEALARGTFLEWLERDAHAWIKAKLSAGALVPRLSPPAGMPGAANWTNRVLEYIATVAIPEVSVIARFIAALLHRDPAMSFGQFANCANRAFHHLSMRCEMPNRSQWTTNCPDSPLFPEQDSIMSTEELLEYVAMQAERLAMKEMGADDSDIQKWRASHREEPYLAGFALEDGSHLAPDLLIPLADAALRTPIDLVVGTKREMLVEAHHPTWRFRYNYFTIGDRRTCPRTGFTVEQRCAEIACSQDDAEWERRLCGLAVVPQPRVCNMWFADFENTDIFGRGMVNVRDAHRFPDARLDPMKAYMDVRQAFRVGLRHALAGKANTEAPALPLHYYDDICSFSGTRYGDDIFRALGSHVLTVSSYLTLALLYGGAPKPDLPSFGAAFFRRLEAFPNVQTDNIRRVYMERPMAEAIFGRQLANALHWWH